MTKELRTVYFKDRFVKRRKYGNRSCTCASNHLHQSRLESAYCDELLILKKAHAIVDYKIQHKFDLAVNGVHITNYYCDFLVFKADGKIEAHETKGFWTDVAKIKWALSKALNPNILHVEKYDKPKLFRGRR